MNSTAVRWATAAERRSAAHTTMNSGVSSYDICLVLTLYKLAESVMRERKCIKSCIHVGHASRFCKSDAAKLVSICNASPYLK